MIYTCSHCGAPLPADLLNKAFKSPDPYFSCRFCGGTIEKNPPHPSHLDIGYEYLSNAEFFLALESFQRAIREAIDSHNAMRVNLSGTSSNASAAAPAEERSRKGLLGLFRSTKKDNPDKEKTALSASEKTDNLHVQVTHGAQIPWAAYLGIALANAQVQVIHDKETEDTNSKPILVCHGDFTRAARDGSDSFAANDNYKRAHAIVVSRAPEERSILEYYQRYIDGLRDEYDYIAETRQHQNYKLFVACNENDQPSVMRTIDLINALPVRSDDIFYTSSAEYPSDSRLLPTLKYDAAVKYAIDHSNGMIAILNQNSDLALTGIYTLYYQAQRKRQNTLGFICLSHVGDILLPGNIGAANVFHAHDEHEYMDFIYMLLGYVPSTANYNITVKAFDGRPLPGVRVDVYANDTLRSLLKSQPLNPHGTATVTLSRNSGLVAVLNGVPAELEVERCYPMTGIDTTISLFPKSADTNQEVTNIGEGHLGMFPQSRVRDPKIVGHFEEYPTPSAADPQDWIPLLADCNGTPYTWYRDEVIDKKRYRAVYFSSFRKAFTVREAQVASYQSRSQYDRNCVYCFSFDPIEWSEYTQNNHVKVLISRKALTCMEFSSNLDMADWESSDLRVWLNSEFLHTAFTENQLNRLLSTTSEEGYGDYVFIPDISADRRFTSLTRRIPSTDYFKCLGGMYDERTHSANYYWTCSPSESTDQATVMYPKKDPAAGSHYVDCTNVAVVPKILTRS